VTVFRGYIDESYDGSQQNVFALSCIVAGAKGWTEFERAWKLHLAAKNKQLKKQGRPQISRYHATDCSGRRNEFAGWTHEERDEFVIGLFGIFKRIPVHVVAYDVQLDELCEVFPEWANDRIGCAYALLPRFLMYTLGEDFNRMFPGIPHKITLFHDRTSSHGKHDPAILSAFNEQLGSGFQYSHYFTTIAPLGWEDCIALQPADLVAFEVFKDAEARLCGRPQRKSLKSLMEKIGIHGRTWNKAGLHALRSAMQEDKEFMEKAKRGEPWDFSFEYRTHLASNNLWSSGVQVYPCLREP
jgi:hypothetical protein